MEEKYRVVAIEPQKEPFEAEMTFSEISTFCGGTVQTLPVYDDKLLLVNENGMMEELPVNRNLILQDLGMQHATILGNFVVIKAEPPEFVGLNQEEVNEALHIFRSTSPTATIII